MKKLLTLILLSFTVFLVNAQTDVTSLITNADMEDHDLTGWTTNMVPQYSGKGGYQAYTGFTASFMETWTGSYNTTDGSLNADGNYYLNDHYAYQKIKVANGTYKLSAMMIAVQQGVSSTTVLQFTKGVKLFANSDSVDCSSYDATPTAFTVFTQVKDSNLTVGVNITNTTANWVAWDNVTLTYFNMSALGGQLQDLIDKVNAAMPNFTVIQDAVITELENALNDADVYADDATISAAMTRLQTAYDAALTSQTAYAALNKSIEDANAVYDPAGTNASDLEAAITAAETTYNNATATTAQVTAMKATLDAAVTTFKTLNADETKGFNYTEYITNPQLYINTNGWTQATGTAAFQHNVAEFYNQDFNLYQAIKVPNGHYRVSVQAFYRLAGSDSGAGYKAGTEVIPAVLYANSKSTPLMSLYANTAADMGITGTDVLNGYVNMRSTADEAFTNGYYKDSLDVIVLDSTLTIGLKVTGHQASSWCAFRDFKLTYYGFDISTNLEILQKEIAEYENTNYSDEPTKSNILLGMFYTLDDMLQDSYSYLNEDKSVVAEVYAKLDSVYKETIAAQDYYANFKSMITDANSLVTNTAYPGKLAFVIVKNQANSYLTNEKGTYAGLIQWCASLKKAIINYKFSQTATNSAPIDASFMITNPSFRVDIANTDSTAARTGEGWDASKTVAASGDYTTYYNMGHTCWNSWSTSFTSMDVRQKIVGLPAGIYSMKCIALTQDGCLNDQHAYIQAPIMTGVSPNMTIAGWGTGTWISGIGTVGNGTWENMPTSKVLISEGDTLCIGFASTHDKSSSNNTNGWFCVTDFMLYYYGTDDSNLYSEYKTMVQTLINEIELKGDKAAVQNYLNAADAATDLSTKYKAISNALTLGNASVKGYTTFMEGAYASLATYIEGTSGYAKSTGDATMKLIDAALAASDATYTNLAAMATLLTSYTSYFTAMAKAEEAAATGDNTYTANMKSLLDAQKSALSNALATTADLEKYTKELTYGAIDIQLSLVASGSGNEDLTFVLTNPTVATNSTGWTQASGSMGWGYNVCEFYNETFNVFQKVYVPNGNYTVSVNGFNRPGANSEATMAAESAATFYVNSVEKPLLSVYANKYEEQLNTNDYMVTVYNADSTEVSYFYYPNNLQGASVAMIDKGDYSNSITLDVTDHNMTIGLKQTKSIVASWTAFCNFTIWLNTLGDNKDWVINSKIDAVKSVPVVKVANGIITVEGCDSYSIYSIDGKRASAGSRLASGIYLVRTGSDCIKVLVK